jgi:hypothetical protein
MIWYPSRGSGVAGIDFVQAGVRLTIAIFVLERSSVISGACPEMQARDQAELIGIQD